MRSLTGLLLPLLLAGTPALAASKPKNAILLSDVQSLTLRADKLTSHRRVTAIPQLRCVSPRAICALHKIDTLRCVNQGHSYNTADVEWACTASLPPTLKLGSTEVICEGYASAEDDYVLKGSCGVEYRLALTEEGERRYPELAGGSKWSGSGEEGTDWAGYIFGVIFFAVLAWIIWSACVQADANRAAAGGQPRRRWGGGGGGGWGGGWGPGGGGGGPWNDPPPPYPGTKPTDQGWRPGFWTGLAGGAAAGYMAGNRRDREDDRYNQGWGRDRSYGGSGWASGSGSGSRASPSSSSGTRHESTGFGSTSRR